MELHMATPSLRADDVPQRVLPDPQSIPAGRALKYRLDVLAIDSAEVAGTIGGWVFDRAMAGWEVNVLLAEPDCGQPLRILGARAGVLAGGADAVFAEAAAGLAVSAALMAAHPYLVDDVRRTTRAGRTEVVVWGGAELAGPVDRVHYRPSAAARVFKRHALTAAGRPDAVIGDVEDMFRGGHRPVDSDLLPVD